MKTVRCAIIGIGSMGKKYALMLGSGKIAGLTLSAVCCRSRENADWAKSNLPKTVRIFKNEDELYGHSQIFDAVIIVTPHKCHPQMSIRALNAGKHVMCDKPAGVTVTDAKNINVVAARTDKVYAMMCHQRTYAQYIKIKELLKSNSIGQITRIMLENSSFFRTRLYHKSGSWRSSWKGEGGGALINQGYHLLDMWQYLFGLPDCVYACIPFGKYNDFQVDDEATLLMEYPNKITGSFIISTGEGASSERLEIVGTGGRIILDNNRLTLTEFDCDTTEYAKTANVTSREELKEHRREFSFEENTNAYEIMLKNFADAILYGEKLIAPGSESADTLSLVNGAYLSAWKGKKVTFPLDEEEYASELSKREQLESDGGR